MVKLQGDWKVSPRPLLFKYSVSCLATHFSIILEINRRLDIGLKFLYSTGSKDGFLSSSLIIACLNNSGIRPDSTEILTILLIINKIVGRRYLSTWPGTGSSSHDLKDVELLIFKSSDDGTAKYMFSWQSVVQSSAPESLCATWSMSWRIFLILSPKKKIKSLAREAGVSCLRRCYTGQFLLRACLAILLRHKLHEILLSVTYSATHFLQFFCRNRCEK